MSHIPEELKYSKNHEWIRIVGNEATMGITDYAQNELTDIIFVELPEVGKKVKKGDVVGVVESVKSVSEVFSPFSGLVKAVNKELEKSPDLVNKEPYGNGWITILTVERTDELDELLSPDEYKKHTGE